MGLCLNPRLSLHLSFLSAGPRGAGRQGRGLSRLGSLPKGASHLGLAGFGDRDRQSKTARGRETCFSGTQLASWERHTREPVSLDWGHLLGRGYGLEQRAPLLSRAHREAGGAKACQASLNSKAWIQTISNQGREGTQKQKQSNVGTASRQSTGSYSKKYA